MCLVVGISNGGFLGIKGVVNHVTKWVQKLFPFTHLTIFSPNITMQSRIFDNSHKYRDDF